MIRGGVSSMAEDSYQDIYRYHVQMDKIISLVNFIHNQNPKGTSEGTFPSFAARFAKSEAMPIESDCGCGFGSGGT